MPQHKKPETPSKPSPKPRIVKKQAGKKPPATAMKPAKKKTAARKATKPEPAAVETPSLDVPPEHTEEAPPPPEPDVLMEVITAEVEAEGAIEVPKVTYPEVCLWDLISPKLRVVNGEDLPIRDTLDALGIQHGRFRDSFGISDSAEIGRRLEMMEFLMRNPELTLWLERHRLPRLDIPTSPEDFLDFYGQRDAEHNPFWETSLEFVQMLKEAQNPPARIRVLLSGLEKSNELENTERRMAQLITGVVETAAVIEGTATFRIKRGDRPQLQSVRAFGHQRFSSDVRQPQFTIPPWARDDGDNRVPRFLKRWAQRRVEKKNKLPNTAALQSTVVSEASSGMLDDICEGLYRILCDKFYNFPIIEDREKGEADTLDGSLIHIHFVYDNELRIRIYGVEPGEKPKDSEGSCLTFDQYRGYPAKVRDMIAGIRQDVMASFATSEQLLRLQRIMSILEAGSMPIKQSAVIKSRRSDAMHRLFAIANMFETAEIKPVVEALKTHRAFVAQHWNILQSMAATLAALQRKGEEIGCEPSLPTMLGSGDHVVAFKTLFPVHLLAELARQQNDEAPKQIVPFTGIPDINGDLIGVTGRHGGGKTSLELAVPINIWMAQSGLPLFSQDFVWNPKTIIGVLVNRPTKGSTCVSLMTKIADILKAIIGVNGNEVVLILDEIGLGTQEASGYKLGHDLLRKLREQGVSVVFSTQITALAEFAEQQLGATCYQVDAEHHISPGIGSGEMEQIRQETGLDDLLAITQD